MRCNYNYNRRKYIGEPKMRNKIGAIICSSNSLFPPLIIINRD